MQDTSAERDRADRVLNESLESILVSGGDDRMHVSPATGLNKYGCAPRIRDAVAFGSCTASSPIRLGLEGARDALNRLRRAARSDGEAGVDLEADALFDEYRLRLRKVLELGDTKMRVAFCPSGTDVEYLALSLVRGGTKQSVVSIVSGPSEVGSGTTYAAGGKHFNNYVPAGDRRTPGDPIDDELGASVRVRTIILRDDAGVMRDSSILDDQAEEAVQSAIDAGSRVVLHIVAHSKTGVHAPSLEQADSLRARFGDKVTVLIDAAQGRLSRRGLREAIDAGYLVMFTGSKFYGGPPFSGALFVPPGLWPETTKLEALPPGLCDYMSAPELPRDWTAARASLPERPNLGLVLRWGAAITQIEAYYATDAERRLNVLRNWERKVPKLLGVSPTIRLFPVDPLQDRDTKRLLESKTTVFPFFLTRPGHEEPLGKSELTRIFYWLNRDISGLLPELDEGQKAVLAREIHIGQPVVLSGGASSERTVLRVALGGTLVTRVADDPRLGPTFEARQNWLRTQVEITRRKIELVVENLDQLLERDPG
jgi:hypothetical protein